MVVPKNGGKLRVCVDYTNLNDAYLKDSFPTTGHGMLSFIDAFFGYHQIPMFQLDEEKTMLITPHRLYYYKVMPFRLKNSNTTCQILMTKIFKPLIGRIVEVYIDDIIMKSRTQDEHTRHLEETFHLMRAYNMKLNLDKCAFGVNVRNFLGFMVTQRGIEVNLNQIRVVLETPTSNNKKELQHVTGRLAALGHFIAHFTDKLKPFFLTLREASMFD